MVKLKKKSGGMKAKDSKSGNLRNKFKKRSQNVLDKTYETREERSKGATGKGIFNDELLEKFGIEVFTPTNGEHFIEVLPLSFSESVPYVYEVSLHYGVGVIGDTFICMNRHNNKPCYRCEQQLVAFRSHTKGAKLPDAIKKLYPTDRAIYLFWDRSEEMANAEEPSYKLKVWAAPKTKVHAEVQALVRDKKTRKTIDISDLSDEEGKTVSFDIVVKKDDYPKYSGFQLLERDEPIPDEILEQLTELIEWAEEEGYENCIEPLLVFPEYDEVKESMLTEETGEEEEENTKTKTKENNSSEEEQEIDEDEIAEQMEELQEELDALSPIKFKMWCKKNGYKSLASEDKSDAIEAIIENEYNKALGEDPAF